MIYGIIGGMSSGKTLVMTQNLYKDYRLGRAIFTNYGLNFNHTKITSQDIIDYTKQSKQLVKTSIGIDEIYIMIDSRTAAAKRNKIVSYFLLQSSKKEINFYYTAQRFNTVDKRLRENTHVLIECVPVLLKIINGKRYEKLFVNREDRLIPDNLKPYFRIKTNWMYFKPLGEPDIFTKYLNPNSVYDLYNTEEIIAIE